MKQQLLATHVCSPPSAAPRLRPSFNYRIQILRLGDISEPLLPRLKEARLRRDQPQSHLYGNGTIAASNHLTLARTLMARRPAQA